MVVLKLRELGQPPVALHLLMQRREDEIGRRCHEHNRQIRCAEPPPFLVVVYWCSSAPFTKSPESFVHFSHCSQYALGIEKLPSRNALSGIFRSSHLARWFAV